MNRLHRSGVLTALVIVSAAAFAQAQQPPENPDPSTTTTEGKASGQITPGKTPTEGATRDPALDPRPPTSQTEGTAADRTPPDEDSAMPGRSAGPVDEENESASDIVGLQVVGSNDAPLGEVVDVVFDAKEQPAFVVIASEGKAAAVPYATASSMMSGDKVVMDQSRLARAPKVKQGEWRNPANSSWKTDASQYWTKGEMKGPDKGKEKG